MSTTTAILEHQLVAARQQERAQQHAKWKEELIAVRKQLRETHARYNALVDAQKAEVAEHAKLRSQTDNIDILIDQSLQQRPAAAAVLTAADDPEIARWEAAHHKLVAARQKLLTRRAAIPATDVVLRAQLYNGIIQLEHQEKNLVGLIADTLNKQDTGSVRPLR